MANQKREWVREFLGTQEIQEKTFLKKQNSFSVAMRNCFESKIWKNSELNLSVSGEIGNLF